MATPAYLRLEIAGSVVEGSTPVTAMDREGTIECHSFTHSVSFLHAERGFAAKRHHEVVAIKKQIDRSSPLLIKALCEGSVVSRTIIDKKTGTITVFAFDEGQGLSEHTAPFDALVYLIDGEAEILISGKAKQLKEGQIIIMPANQPHSVKAVKKFKMVLTMIRS